jgi:hypothetical protein
LGQISEILAALGFYPEVFVRDVYADQSLPGHAALHCLTDIDGFVVPLYEKMYLSAENLLKLYPKILYAKFLDIPAMNKLVARVYMTSSRSYKRRLRESKQSIRKRHRHV